MDPLEPAGTVARPLAGIRVLALEQLGAGPWATSHLAELGADIVKVESPSGGGDSGRYVPPFQDGEHSLFFETLNAGKRSISLDLRHPRGREVLEALVARSDAVFSNLRGDQPARLGLRYADLEAVNPRVVCVSLTGYGTTGPRAAEGAYDYVVQGYAGWMTMTGEPGAPPTRTGLSLVDLSAGFAAATALLSGLLAAGRTGRGGDYDVALLDTALALEIYAATWHLSRGWLPERTRNSAHPSMVPFQNFPTADGWIVVCVAKESLFGRLCDALGVPVLVADERFATFAARRRHRDEVLDILERRFAADTTEHWLGELRAGGIPCGPVNDLAAAFEDPQVKARSVVVETEHPVLGTVRRVRTPVREVGAEPLAARGPFRGEHTRAVLGEAGFDEAAVDALAATGAFGDVPA